jgi:hypothetical protein
MKEEKKETKNSKEFITIIEVKVDGNLNERGSSEAFEL